MSAPDVEAARAALEVALRDFQHPTPVELRLELETRDDDDLLWVVGDDGSSGFWLGDDPSPADVLVQVADHLQDQVFDQLAQTWGEARPPCPGHPHAPDPVLVDDQAWWRCPATGAHLARIGSLRPSDPGPS